MKKYISQIIKLVACFSLLMSSIPNISLIVKSMVNEEENEKRSVSTLMNQDDEIKGRTFDENQEQASSEYTEQPSGEDHGIEMVDDNSLELEAKSNEVGLVQLWFEAVPGQGGKEGITDSEVRRKIWDKCPVNHDLLPIQDNQNSTYVNSCYVDDAAYIGQAGDYYYIYLSGYEGKIAKYAEKSVELDLNGDGKKVSYSVMLTATFIPVGTSTYATKSVDEDTELMEFSYQTLNKFSDVSNLEVSSRASKTVQSPSYYINKNGDLYHYISKDVTTANKYSSVIVGKAPTWMERNIKYYSYDGIYFYNHWSSIKANGDGSINKNNPFYNYYQYLPIRSKSNYTSINFDTYTNNNGGIGGKLVEAGKYFEAVQDKFGINGALQYAMGIHESGWGKSNLSINKNNLFGMNATDNNPYGNGLSFPSIESGINYHADRYLSWGYTDPLTDSRYFGSHVGNKGSGMNVKYASDPFWGEKISGWYYKIDKDSGMKDYDYYTIGIKQSYNVYNVRSNSSTSSSILYKTRHRHVSGKVEYLYNIRNYPVLIIGEDNGFYKIQSDTPIINGSAVYNGSYDWVTSVGYITKDAISSNTLNNTNFKQPSGSAEGYIEFVTNAFKVALNREPDQEGLNYWVNLLVTGQLTIGDFVRSVVDSGEFKSRNLNNSEFVDVIFRLVLEREPDSEGEKYYLDKLEHGLTWDYLVVNAVNSPEFSYIATKKNISLIPISYMNTLDIYEHITLYVDNFFRVGLNRRPDEEGLNYWVTSLANHSASTTDFTITALSGDEMTHRNLTNEELVDVLFRGLLGREPDIEGKNYWVDILNSGKSRKDVAIAATHSGEFEYICNSLGIRIR